jgi:formimidoylglutamate deiminase
MEYQARLRELRRGVLADDAETHVGTRLWRETARTGAAALGQTAGVIAQGSRADWVVLDAEHPAMAGSSPDTALDHLVFAGGAAAIRDVMVAGRWVVKDRRHPAEESSAAKFGPLMARFATESS